MVILRWDARTAPPRNPDRTVMQEGGLGSSPLWESGRAGLGARDRRAVGREARDRDEVAADHLGVDDRRRAETRALTHLQVLVFVTLARPLYELTHSLRAIG